MVKPNALEGICAGSISYAKELSILFAKQGHKVGDIGFFYSFKQIGNSPIALIKDTIFL
tara:strand:+ start:3317 stop:3493 length:177 start_codon:yes stop_codon:yes gene_type:complete